MKLRGRCRHFAVVTTRVSPLRWAFLFLLVGCATAPPAAAPDDRYAVTRMKNGPSLYETGRFAAVPVSSGGLHIEEGAIDRPPPARPLPPPVAVRAHRRTKSRARAQRTP